MSHQPYPEAWYAIDTETYDWSVRAFRALSKMLQVKMNLYGEEQLRQGDIFLFNHFARFETFIPQFLIHQRTGAYSWAIASAEFFEEDDALARFLKNVGVIPHDHPRLFPILAKQLLHGQKVVIFPEGGMVKDRRVMDSRGRYSILSRLTGERRKQHTGAAVLAQGLEAFKATVRNAYSAKNRLQLQRWKEQLQMDSIDQLLDAALKPTLIVPANITFYPIRSSDNLLHQSVELFAGHLTPRQTEELLIEGNILLKDTDMDLRLGEPVDPYQTWHWWNHIVLELAASEFFSLDDIFNLHDVPKNLKQRLLSYYFKKNAQITRNAYMEQIYANVTINLSHLASTLIMYSISQGYRQIEKRCFYTTLYVAVKHLQQTPGINLHASLLNPEDYYGLPDGKGKRLEQFIEHAESSGLIVQEQQNLHFQPKLYTEYDIDTIRLENAIAVYANEAAPLPAVRTTLVKALHDCGTDIRRQLARWFFEDECRALLWAKQLYAQPEFDDINRHESATADPEPFLLLPKAPNGVGALLIHGLLASPAELKVYGEYLLEQGYTVMGVRLKGHGTSPYDLREQAWEDWYESVQKGYVILNSFCPRMIVVGFSTGGALGLRLSATYTESVEAVIVAAVPIKFINPAFMLLPLLQGANQLLEWTTPFEGINAFIDNEAEHPRVNYRNVPVRSLFELRKLIQSSEQLWPAITTPTLILHASHDPVVDVESASILLQTLGSEDKRLILIDAAHHGILMSNSENCWTDIDNFLHDLDLP
ncbi:MAG: alpha/beta fold hydrolase [Gammaproteobacteria bacterium]